MDVVRPNVELRGRIRTYLSERGMGTTPKKQTAGGARIGHV
jgi:hypothetical protein